MRHGNEQMANTEVGKKIVQRIRERGITIELNTNGTSRYVKWRAPVGAMTEELERFLFLFRADVEAYLMEEARK